MTRVSMAMALAALLTAGCEKETASPVDLGTETAADDSGTVQISIALLERPGPEAERAAACERPRSAG